MFNSKFLLYALKTKQKPTFVQMNTASRGLVTGFAHVDCSREGEGSEAVAAFMRWYLW